MTDLIYKEFIAERSRITSKITKLHAQLAMVEMNMTHWRKHNLPKCSCCGRHQPTNSMWIASREEEDKYTDENNEGYSGPIAGELYCGC